MGEIFLLRSFNVLKMYIDKNNLVDIWRKLNRHKKLYTLTQSKPGVSCRLDYFLTPQTQAHLVRNAQIDLTSTISDHKPVIIKFSLSRQGEGTFLLEIQ